MFTSQATIERRAAKEKRLATAEERLAVLEKSTKVATVDLTPMETRLSALENKPAPVADFGPVESRLAALEAVKPVDLSSIESRLVALEATLKALAARSDDHSEGAADIRSRLETVEASAAIVRKELDDLKTKKSATGGFNTAATATIAKSFTYPAKKKEDPATE